jgi:hypothetical protein
MSGEHNPMIDYVWKDYIGAVPESELNQLWTEFKERNPEYYHGLLNYRVKDDPEGDQYSGWFQGMRSMVMYYCGEGRYGSIPDHNIYLDMEEFFNRYLNPRWAKAAYDG